MTIDDKDLKRLPLTKPSAALDARMNRLFSNRPAPAWRLRGVPLPYALAACVISAFTGAMFSMWGHNTPETQVSPVRVVYVERAVRPASSNPYDWSRTSIPRLWDAPPETVVITTVEPGQEESQTTDSGSSV